MQNDAVFALTYQQLNFTNMSLLWYFFFVQLQRTAHLVPYEI